MLSESDIRTPGMDQSLFSDWHHHKYNIIQMSAPGLHAWFQLIYFDTCARGGAPRLIPF